ncbi:MAG: hypothetical protein NVS2B4_04500 [Ramlibacter sp.]
MVASGQFLVDSEASLRSVLSGMAAAGQGGPASGAPASSASAPMPAMHAPTAAKGAYTAQGKVESVEPDSITISHGPVPELKWPAMTMGFGKPDPKAFSEIKPGDTVRFEFKQSPGGYDLVTVQPAGAGK